MDEREKSDRGVIFAATLLQLIAAPFILVTTIVCIGLLFAPYALARAEINGSSIIDNRFFIYAIFMMIMLICYSVSSGMMMVAATMKSNHDLSKRRETTKSRLYALVDNLLIMIGLSFVIGSVLAVFFLYIQDDLIKKTYDLEEISLFLITLTISGIAVFLFRRFILSLNWWRIPWSHG